MKNVWTLFKDLTKKEQDIIIVNFIDEFYDNRIHFDDLDPRVPTSDSIRKRLSSQTQTFYIVMDKRIFKTRKQTDPLPNN